MQEILIIELPDPSEDDLNRVRKRVHDIRAAKRTLKMALDALAGGYRFDDALAEAKIEALAKAAKLIDTELKDLENALLKVEG